MAKSEKNTSNREKVGMTRKTRGEQRFAAITYRQIAEWTGLTLETVRSYGAHGLIPKDDLEATICWVNERRRRKGRSPIGAPDTSS